ncbi:hypothetical protein AVEN_153722-1 [Araneus ventricosus]|uniref:Uncharacterized protein n=1 Tax=Araneus ventricosus TaxID=182803 RepID=A0A4Y2SFZ9_ARAVE|nr:hypothetical protein AVEN_153722-1 [Araneus ventricosus]
MATQRNGKFPHPSDFNCSSDNSSFSRDREQKTRAITFALLVPRRGLKQRRKESNLSWVIFLPPSIWVMGSGLSTSSRAAVKLTNDECYRTDSNRNQFK